MLSPYFDPNPPAGAHYIEFEHTFEGSHDFMMSAFSAQKSVNPFYVGFSLQKEFGDFCSGKFF